MPKIAHSDSAPARAAPTPHFPASATSSGRISGEHAPAHPDNHPLTIPHPDLLPADRPAAETEHHPTIPPGSPRPAPSPPATTPTPPAEEPVVYEWDLFIEAPFPIDLLKLLFAILRLPGQVIRRSSETASGRLSFALRVLSYNFGIIALVLAAIPLALFVFSYIATLPFIILRTLANWTGDPAMAWIAAFVFAGALALVVYLYNVLFRPEAWRDNYKRTKIDLLNIFINAGFFIAGGALEYLIASPSFFISKDFKGSTESTLQWTLFFADKSLNLLFANIPQRYIGDLSNISTIRGGDGVAIGLLRILLIFGYVIGVRLVALKLFFSRRELFYGTIEECRRYLDLCGKAEAYSLRRVINTPGSQSIYLRSRFAPRRPLVGAPPREGRPPRDAESNGNGHGNGHGNGNGQGHPAAPGRRPAETPLPIPLSEEALPPTAHPASAPAPQTDVESLSTHARVPQPEAPNPPARTSPPRLTDPDAELREQPQPPRPSGTNATPKHSTPHPTMPAPETLEIPLDGA